MVSGGRVDRKSVRKKSKGLSVINHFVDGLRANFFVIDTNIIIIIRLILFTLTGSFGGNEFLRGRELRLVCFLARNCSDKLWQALIDKQRLNR